MTETTSIKLRQLAVNIVKYALLIFAAFVALVPIVSCVVTAFKTEEEYAAGCILTTSSRRGRKLIWGMPS